MYNIEKDIVEKGYIAEKINSDIELSVEIKKLSKQKNAVILGHYYLRNELQDIADYIGDSLGLSQQAAKTGADIIVFVGVHFMAETAKILSPDKKVILPDLNAGCSLADSCPTGDFEQFVSENPDHTVVTYVNTTAEIKALSDIMCTSSNAVDIVNSLPEDEKIIFAPDKNLGNYVAAQTGRDMLIWDGACHVHQEFSLDRILAIKQDNKDTEIICHPECEKPIHLVSDYVGSTSGMLNYVQKSSTQKFIVATESGILHQMRKAEPEKTFIAAPPEDAACACSDCNFMKLNTLEKLYNCIKYEQPEIVVPEKIRKLAYEPIKRMLDISKKIGK